MKYRTEWSYAIHEKIIEKTGGLSGYNGIGYLASALEHIKNDDYYPTIRLATVSWIWRWWRR